MFRPKIRYRDVSANNRRYGWEAEGMFRPQYCASPRPGYSVSLWLGSRRDVSTHRDQAEQRPVSRVAMAGKQKGCFDTRNRPPLQAPEGVAMAGKQKGCFDLDESPILARDSYVAMAGKQKGCFDSVSHEKKNAFWPSLWLGSRRDVSTGSAIKLTLQKISSLWLGSRRDVSTCYRPEAGSLMGRVAMAGKQKGCFDRVSRPRRVPPPGSSLWLESRRDVSTALQVMCRARRESSGEQASLF